MCTSKILSLGKKLLTKGLLFKVLAITLLSTAVSYANLCPIGYGGAECEDMPDYKGSNEGFAGNPNQETDCERLGYRDYGASKSNLNPDSKKDFWPSRARKNGNNNDAAYNCERCEVGGSPVLNASGYARWNCWRICTEESAATKMPDVASDAAYRRHFANNQRDCDKLFGKYESGKSKTHFEWITPSVCGKCSSLVCDGLVIKDNKQNNKAPVGCYYPCEKPFALEDGALCCNGKVWKEMPKEWTTTKRTDGCYDTETAETASGGVCYKQKAMSTDCPEGYVWNDHNASPSCTCVAAECPEGSSTSQDKEGCYEYNPVGKSGDETCWEATPKECVDGLVLDDSCECVSPGCPSDTYTQAEIDEIKRESCIEETAAGEINLNGETVQCYTFEYRSCPAGLLFDSECNCVEPVCPDGLHFAAEECGEHPEGWEIDLNDASAVEVPTETGTQKCGPCKPKECTSYGQDSMLKAECEILGSSYTPQPNGKYSGDTECYNCPYCLNGFLNTVNEDCREHIINDHYITCWSADGAPREPDGENPCKLHEECSNDFYYYPSCTTRLDTQICSGTSTPAGCSALDYYRAEFPNLKYGDSLSSFTVTLGDQYVVIPGVCDYGTEAESSKVGKSILYYTTCKTDANATDCSGNRNLAAGKEQCKKVAPGDVSKYEDAPYGCVVCGDHVYCNECPDTCVPLEDSACQSTTATRGSASSYDVEYCSWPGDQETWHKKSCSSGTGKYIAKTYCQYNAEASGVDYSWEVYWEQCNTPSDCDGKPGPTYGMTEVSVEEKVINGQTVQVIKSTDGKPLGCDGDVTYCGGKAWFKSTKENCPECQWLNSKKERLSDADIKTIVPLLAPAPSSGVFECDDEYKYYCRTADGDYREFYLLDKCKNESCADTGLTCKDARATKYDVLYASDEVPSYDKEVSYGGFFLDGAYCTDNTGKSKYYKHNCSTGMYCDGRDAPAKDKTACGSNDISVYEDKGATGCMVCGGDVYCDLCECKASGSEIETEAVLNPGDAAPGKPGYVILEEKCSFNGKHVYSITGCRSSKGPVTDYAECGPATEANRSLFSHATECSGYLFEKGGCSLTCNPDFNREKCEGYGGIFEGMCGGTDNQYYGACHFEDGSRYETFEKCKQAGKCL